MNATTADFDGNGLPDVYVSNVHHKIQAEGGLLWLNDGVTVRESGRFHDEAMAMGALNERRFGWGAAAGDLDRDGRMDIVQANGMVDNIYEPEAPQGTCPDYWYWNENIALTAPMVHGYADRWADLRGRCIFPAEQNRVCLNKGKYFVDVAPQVGWQAKGASRGVALANFDSHGSLDVLITKQFAPAMLYRNKTTQQKAWVGICLVGNGRTCNRDALGNKVIVAGPHGPQMREQVAANGFSAQSEHRLLFGLGEAKAIAPVAVTVDWCGRGPRQVFQLTANDYHRLEQK